MMRATNDAILIPIGAALPGDPRLTCRLKDPHACSPARGLFDAELRLPRGLEHTARRVRLWPIAALAAQEVTHLGDQKAIRMLPIPGIEAAERGLRAQGVNVLRGGAPDGRVDIAAALRLLAGQGVTRLMVEGGPRVAASFVAADLVDEAAVLRSAKAIGADGIDALDRMPLSVLTGSPRLRLREIETIGEDTLETYERS
jgi:diaminohydroxyphosphoribosylaminopyrimidine deaminase/5-amino-6-(5-phosphoribosylamino)uracil reductase